MSNDHLRSLRTNLEWLKKEGLLLETDHEIDQMVYQLYELTEEEIKIVEESVK